MGGAWGGGLSGRCVCQVFECVCLHYLLESEIESEVPFSSSFQRLKAHVLPVSPSLSFFLSLLFLKVFMLSCIQSLAEDGALILGERLRSMEERQVVADVLARVMNAKVRVC